MDSKYYLALFNSETWNEFLENGSSVYGTNLNKKKRMEKIAIGDFLICYVSKLSCFVGLLEVTSKTYLDDHRIWKNDIYQVRIDVRPVYILETKSGIPVLDLREKLEMFKKLKSKKVWSFFFMNNLNTFQEDDAKIIINKLKEKSNK